MISLLIAAAIFRGVLGVPIDGPRIVGGDDAKPGEFPFIVSIRADGQHVCGGSILGEQSVLTAAHCTAGWNSYPEAFSIQYGILRLDEQLNIAPISNVTVHEGYTIDPEYPNDIAILKLATPILFSEHVSAVELPSANELPAGRAALAGWGATQTGAGNTVNLQRVDLDVFDDATCKNYEPLYDPLYHICAGKIEGGKSQCSGDSGGPLTVHGKQFGIVSWSRKPCGSPGHPGVLTKVVNYVQWIKQHM